MYAMLNTSGVHPMEAAAHVLGGYYKHRKLSDEELNHLKLCVCARFAQSYTIGLYAASLNPEDTYVMHHAQRIWPKLKVMWETTNDEILRDFTKHIYP